MDIDYKDGDQVESVLAGKYLGAKGRIRRKIVMMGNHDYYIVDFDNGISVTMRDDCIRPVNE